MADFEGQKSSGDGELENFLMIEKQKAQVNAQVRKKKKISPATNKNLIMFYFPDSRVQ